MSRNAAPGWHSYPGAQVEDLGAHVNGGNSVSRRVVAIEPLTSLPPATENGPHFARPHSAFQPSATLHSVVCTVHSAVCNPAFGRPHSAFSLLQPCIHLSARCRRATTDHGSNVHFSFAIPRGQTGNYGAQGPQGPAFGTAVVDNTTTLNPGENANVSVSFDGMNVHFNFGIPRGADGATGPQGPTGATGEVTNAALETAIAGTSANSNTVATLDVPFSDPPTLADLEAVRAKMNELISALRR